MEDLKLIYVTARDHVHLYDFASYFSAKLIYFVAPRETRAFALLSAANELVVNEERKCQMMRKSVIKSAISAAVDVAFLHITRR